MQKKRIQFIDLAKGICIILVVFGHAGYPIYVPGFYIVRMPLYFMLSGLFFKNYGGFQSFTIKKVNKILIPFLFFYLIGYLFFYLLKWLMPELLITDSKGILDMFNNRQFFNGPIWFLLALFWCNLFFCFLTSFIKNDYLNFVFICLIGFLGWYLGYRGIFIPLFIDVAMTSLPFFTMGYFLKKTDILYPNKYDKYNILFFLSLWIVSFIVTISLHQRMSLHYNTIEGWSTYLLSFTSVMSILFLCKALKHIPFITYIGRYSIILLCVHHMIYRPLIVLFNLFPDFLFKNFTIALLTLLLSAACIPVCKKWIPWFVAQKDLIKIEV